MTKRTSTLEITSDEQCVFISLEAIRNTREECKHDLSDVTEVPPDMLRVMELALDEFEGKRGRIQDLLDDGATVRFGSFSVIVETRK